MTAARATPIASNRSRYFALSIAFSLGLLLRGSDRPLVDGPAGAGKGLRPQIVETFGPAGKCPSDLGRVRRLGQTSRNEKIAALLFFWRTWLMILRFLQRELFFGHRHA